MTSPTPSVLRRFADVIDARDWDALARLLSPGFTGRFVHSGQEFDRDGFVALNRDYPGVWRFELEDEVAADDRAVGRSRVSNDEQTYFVATFLRHTDGLITELVEVWTDAVTVPG